MRQFLSVSTLMIAAALGHAATTVEFTVSAGKHDRVNEPVCVPLQLPGDEKVPLGPIEVFASANSLLAVGELVAPSLATAGLKAADGKQRLDLCFVLPRLKAGQNLALKATVGKPVGATVKGFVWTTKDGEHWVELRQDKRPILRYEHAPLDESSKAARDKTYKVFHHVYDPAGERLVTNGPGGRFPHHRGLFYGFAKTSYDKHLVDIWHCSGQTHQAHRAFRAVSAGPAMGRQLVEIDWNGLGKATFARELRELTVWNVPGGTLIDFASRLQPTGPDVKLDGDPQHAGFHFRAANEVAEKDEAADKKKGEKQTIYVRSDGVDKAGATRNWDGKKNTSHVNLPWLAMSFVLGDKRYTTAYLDRPDNPKEARYSERSYGRFGSYFVTTVTKEKPLLVRYRVWLQEGQMKPAEVQALSTAFVEPVAVKVK